MGGRTCINCAVAHVKHACRVSVFECKVNLADRHEVLTVIFCRKVV